MKIEKYKKQGKGKYKITLEDNSEITLYEDVIIKNELLIKKDIDLSLIEKVIEDNQIYEAYDKALSLIEKKLRTEKEIRLVLDDMGFNSRLVNEVVERLINERYIDDKRYIEAYINDKINLTNYGPFKISKCLSDAGIENEYIEEYLSAIDDNVWKERINKLISKKTPSLKGKSSYMIKNKLNQYLFDLGYQKDFITEAIESIKLDEEVALKKEMSKAYDKLSKKYTGEELNRQIKNYLYRKGFKVDSIEY